VGRAKRDRKSKKDTACRAILLSRPPPFAPPRLNSCPSLSSPSTLPSIILLAVALCLDQDCAAPVGFELYHCGTINTPRWDREARSIKYNRDDRRIIHTLVFPKLIPSPTLLGPTLQEYFPLAILSPSSILRQLRTVFPFLFSLYFKVLSTQNIHQDQSD